MVNDIDFHQLNMKPFKMFFFGLKIHLFHFLNNERKIILMFVGISNGSWKSVVSFGNSIQYGYKGKGDMSFRWV